MLSQAVDEYVMLEGPAIAPEPDAVVRLENVMTPAADIAALARSRADVETRMVMLPVELAVPPMEAV